MLHRVLKAIAPIAALGLGAGLAGCGNMDLNINGENGVPLAELDMSGEAPTELVLAGPDNVVVTEGDALSIEPEGSEEAVSRLRFSLKDGALGIMRANRSGSDGGKATVRVTMPLPREVVLAGSGTIALPGMTGDSEATIAGSGTANIGEVDAGRLEVTIAGSGTLEGSGSVRDLELTIAGSGDAKLSDLRVATADVTVAGSGSAAFASDGTVDASIMGSGDVTVRGRATCTVESMGSGKLRCEAGNVQAQSDEGARAERTAERSATRQEREESTTSADAATLRAEADAKRAEAVAARAEADAARAEADAARAERNGE